VLPDQQDPREPRVIMDQPGVRVLPVELDQRVLREKMAPLVQPGLQEMQDQRVLREVTARPGVPDPREPREKMARPGQQELPEQPEPME
jgi:hypothetical protein